MSSAPPTSSSTALSESTASSTPSRTSTTNHPTEQQKKETLALPASTPDSKTIGLDLSTGEATIKLDHLGPMVVNVDGTLSRISNWDGMADVEKKNTLRMIAKRNQIRLDALRKKEGGE